MPMTFSSGREATQDNNLFRSLAVRPVIGLSMSSTIGLSAGVGQGFPHPEVCGFQRGLLEGLLMRHPMANTFKIPLLCEVMLKAMTAAAGGVLPGLLGCLVDCRHIGGIIAFQPAMVLDVSFQPVISFQGNIVLGLLPALLL